jgi:hypothetical protein
MTDRSRVAITLATALALGAFAYGSAYAIRPPGALGDIWHSSGWVVYGLAIVGVFFVYRWWALLPAIAPIAVTAYINTMTDYVYPWRSESIGSPNEPVGYVFLLLLAIFLHAAFLALGLLLRAAWESVRSKRRRGTLQNAA